MGKHRFKFSDMIPNAWFYKLKDMSKTRGYHHMKKKQGGAAAATTTLQKPHISLPRYSYYFTTEPIKADKLLYPSPVNPKASDTHFPDPSKKNIKRRTVYKPSPKHFSNPDYFETSTAESPIPNSDEDDSWTNANCNCGLTCSTTDIIIDLNDNNYITQDGEKLVGFDSVSELELPPILTKPAKFHRKKPQLLTKFRTQEKIKAHRTLSVKIVKEERIRTQKEQKTSSPARKSSSSNSTGFRLSRANSPRIASKKLQAYARKSTSSSSSNKYSKVSQNTSSLSESFIVVKSSVDPLRDFRESMLEMIVENNLRTTKDLEDLLACYLSLNSNEYQDLIIKAFEQIWFDITNLRL